VSFWPHEFVGVSSFSYRLHENKAVQWGVSLEWCKYQSKTKPACSAAWCQACHELQLHCLGCFLGLIIYIKQHVSHMPVAHICVVSSTSFGCVYGPYMTNDLFRASWQYIGELPERVGTRNSMNVLVSEQRPRENTTWQGGLIVRAVQGQLRAGRPALLILPPRHRVQTFCGAHPTSYPTDTGGPYPRDKAAGAWS
jgi:hypothetical protein